MSTRQQRVILHFLVTYFALLLGSSALACPLRVLTGPSSGYYEKLLRQALDTVELPDCEIIFLPSGGSHENLLKLNQGQADLALIQGDTLLRNKRRGHTQNVEVLSYGYFEFIHLLSRPSLKLRHFSDLRGMKVWIGPKSSGSREIAQELLDVFSIASQDSALFSSPSIGQLSTAFLERDLDAAIVTSASNATWLQEGLTSHAFMINNLSMGDVKLLLDRHDDLAFDEVKSLIRIAQHDPDSETETRQEKVFTVNQQLAIPTFLTMKAGLNPRISEQVINAFSEAFQSLRRASKQEVILLGLPLDISELGLKPNEHFHPLSQEYIDDNQRLNQLITFTLILFLGVLILARHTDRLRYFVMHQTLTFSFLSIFILCLISTLGTYLSEHTINENFSDLPSSFWSILIYLFSGLEDREPYSSMGKVFSIITIVTGPLIIAIFSGAVASALIKNFLGAAMPNTLKDHYLIINASPHIPAIVQELRAPVANSASTTSVIVILLSSHHEGDEELKMLGEAYSDIYFSYGDTTCKQALHNVHAHQARSILILSPKEGDELNPLQSLLSLKHLLTERGATCNTTIELTKPQMIGLIQDMGRDFPGGLDYLARGELNSLMLSQSILNPGLTGFYRDLMSVSGDNNEAYMIELPQDAVGMNFIEYSHELLKNHDQSPYILVGVKRPIGKTYQLVCNPRSDHPLYHLKAGDYLVLLAYDPPLRESLPLS